MDKIWNYCIPLICGVYYLLIVYGIVKLPQHRQLQFDGYSKTKKKVFIILAYALIAASAIAIIWDLALGRTSNR
jgi:hypothetical protein